MASAKLITLPPLVEPAGELSQKEIERYSRHLIIPEVGLIGQRRIKNAKILVIGAGGLGSPTLLYLAWMLLQRSRAAEMAARRGGDPGGPGGIAASP